jgi:acyl-CoA synthetase (AMP-forming)/AMP-acid ligase II
MTSEGQPPAQNIADYLPRMASLQPDAPAILCPAGRDSRGEVRYRQISYAELDQQSSAIANGLQQAGITRGMRCVLMVKPSLELFTLTFGLFKAGVVPVMVDPGIGLRHLKGCLAQAEPAAFIGISAAHAARLLMGWGRGSVKHLVTVGRRWLWGGSTLNQLLESGQAEQNGDTTATEGDDLAAILFTSGSTGPPKGVIYQHRNFSAQVEIIRELYTIEPGEVDLPTFPLFALFDPAFGMTTIIPDMDASRPAAVDPRKIIEAINRFNVTNMFGSPALLNTVGRYGEKRQVKMPSLRRVISAGAPVSTTVQERFLGMLEPEALIHTPYGATESLPVSSANSRLLLQPQIRQKSDQGGGTCVGQPVAAARVRVIAISDDAIEHWHQAQELAAGEIGEITVSSPTVTEAYYKNPQATRLAKILDGETIIHRMGDLGYFDEQGRLWFCGRKAHRVETRGGTLFSVPCEGVFNTHPAVFRSALVGVPSAAGIEPVICIELEQQHKDIDASRLFDELETLGQTQSITRHIKRFLIHPAFPVDVRHNAKIGREQLAVWAAAQT